MLYLSISKFVYKHVLLHVRVDVHIYYYYYDYYMIVIVSICIYLHSRSQPKIEKRLTSIQINIVE